MDLRDYQNILIEQVYAAWTSGAQNILMQLPTGGGKTRIFCKIISEYTGNSIIIAHRVELISQISLTLASYSLTHNIKTNKTALNEIITLHFKQYGRSYYDFHAKITVIGVDALIKLDTSLPWLRKITLVIQDEGHHVLKNNKWGKAANYFPSARGLYPTATPRRADGNGLSRQTDGIIDRIVSGPSFTDLINGGFLVPYQIFAPKTDIDLTDIPLAPGGDFSPQKLRTAVHKSTITGNAVKHYQKLCPGALAVAFTVDVESATKTALEFKEAGILSEVISCKTPPLLRYHLLAQFRRREINVLVNVDLFGEGVDVPEIETIIMLRPTQSFSLYVQQFGRALRLSPGKTKAIIIDHVGNVVRHGLPDPVIPYSLDRRERRSATQVTTVPIRVCLNEECMQVYERIYPACPYCHFKNPVASRSTPLEVEGDLTELDLTTLYPICREIDRIDGAPKFPANLAPGIQRNIIKNHEKRQEMQAELRRLISQYAGFYRHHRDFTDSMIYRKFFLDFNTDILTAQTFNVKDAENLSQKIIAEINLFK